MNQVASGHQLTKSQARAPTLEIASEARQTTRVGCAPHDVADGNARWYPAPASGLFYAPKSGFQGLLQPKQAGSLFHHSTG
jgi:hypothetical protein